jgi:hypothetical protein
MRPSPLALTVPEHASLARLWSNDTDISKPKHNTNCSVAVFKRWGCPPTRCRSATITTSLLLLLDAQWTANAPKRSPGRRGHLSRVPLIFPRTPPPAWKRRHARHTHRPARTALLSALAFLLLQHFKCRTLPWYATSPPMMHFS